MLSEKLNNMNTTESAVFITFPKCVTISNGALTKIRPAPAASPISSGYSSTSSSTNSMDDYTPPKGKKRRLDHLTWEEKIQRKKLKNRVAAQSSRDRKKAHMEQMEIEIKSLHQSAEILQNKCDSLQAINDSYLEKNQKLNTEVELLRQQVAKLQQQQKAQSNASSDCSKVVESCAGSGINGLTVDTKSTTKEQHDGGTLEDCCPLPALQDMLLLDEEFDASKLEELAESLLADITANMETSDRKSNETIAETTSGAERLSGSVVGTETERLESSKHSTRNSCVKPTNPKEQHNALQNELQTIKCDDFNLNSEMTIASNCNSNDEITTEPIIITTTPNDAYDNVVYGNYDAKTNSITIVMDDDTVPVNEAVEEIYCDGIAPPQADDVIDCPSPVASPSQIYLNVECSDDENDPDVDIEDDLKFDPISKFLQPRRPLISPLGKSPAPSLYSATSDHGYESIMGSPTIPSSEHFQTSSIIGRDVDDDFGWNESFDELFPTLI